MLEATRTRISFSGEVLTAAAFLAATVLVGLLIVRELRVAPRALSAAAQTTATPAAVPPEAVSVPALTFGANEIKVGDGLAAALARLDPTIKMTNRIVETGPLGQREVRSYEVSGMRFILVAEPFDANRWASLARSHLDSADPRVAGRTRARWFSAELMAERVLVAYRELLGDPG